MKIKTLKALAIMIILNGNALMAQTVFKFAFQAGLSDLDPQSSTSFHIGTMSNVYDPLISRDKHLNLIPALATSWQRLSDKQWQFKLRKNVKFHGGEDFDAQDVAFTIERGRNSGISSISNRIKQVKVIDPHTIVIETKKAFSLLPGALTSVLIMDKGWTEKNGATDYTVGAHQLITSNQANGTGLFQVVKHRHGTISEFVRFKNHWNKNTTTNIDRVIFTPIGQDTTRVSALLSGAVDLAYPIAVQDQNRIRKAKNLNMLTAPETRTIFLGLNQNTKALSSSNVKGKNPFKDKRVRQAMAYAINNELIAKKVMRGQAYPTGTIVAKYNNYPGDDVAQPYGFNLKKAKKLMKEAGYPTGFQVQLDCPNNRYVNDEKICQSIVPMLTKIGIEVQLNAQPKSQFFSKVLKSGGYDTDFYLLGLSPSALDAMSIAEYAVACRDLSDNLGSTNLGNYCNPSNNDLLTKANNEYDSSKRQKIIRQVFINTKNDVGYIPLHNQSLAWGINSGFKVIQRADNVLLWRNITKK